MRRAKAMIAIGLIFLFVKDLSITGFDN